MASLAKQSMSFAARAEASPEELGRQLQQLRLRLAAEQQCVLREQHITARMWIEKSAAEERAEAAEARANELQAQVDGWVGWHDATRRQQRQLRQQRLGVWAAQPEKLLQSLLQNPAAPAAPSAAALSREQRDQLAAALRAAAQLVVSGAAAAAPAAAAAAAPAAARNFDRDWRAREQAAAEPAAEDERPPGL